MGPAICPPTTYLLLKAIKIGTSAVSNFFYLCRRVSCWNDLNGSCKMRPISGCLQDNVPESGTYASCSPLLKYCPDCKINADGKMDLPECKVSKNPRYACPVKCNEWNVAYG